MSLVTNRWRRDVGSVLIILVSVAAGVLTVCVATIFVMKYRKKEVQENRSQSNVDKEKPHANKYDSLSCLNVGPPDEKCPDVIPDTGFSSDNKIFCRQMSLPPYTEENSYS
ncbi:uncharacterized protein LOC143232866 [Tachypleus tridentatus]|uniref:uncharacterized protein LOC143232866 n=1 Tax=Tachypleus tridentatus TaxID=6853 RepID=UPI003FD027B8